MDPYEKYDMTFNGAVATRNPTSSPGRYAGMDNGWAISLSDIPLSEFNQSIVKYPNNEALPGRSFERHDPESAEPEESAALRSDQGAEDHRSALAQQRELVRICRDDGRPRIGRPLFPAALAECGRCSLITGRGHRMQGESQ